MSDKKKLTVLASLCAVLTLTLVFGMLFSGNRRSSRALNQPIVPAFSEKQVSRIEVFHEAKTVTVFAGEKGLWMVDYDGTPAAADAETVKTFLSAVVDLPCGKKITANEEKYDAFGVASQGALSFIRLTMFNGKETQLLIGNAVADRPGFRYARLEGDRQVYETSDIGMITYGNRASWVNLRLFSDALKKDEAISLSVKGKSPLEGGEHFDYIFIRTVDEENNKELVWKVEGSETAIDGWRVDSLVRQIIELKGADLVIPSTGITPENAAVVLVIGFGDGSKQTVCVSATAAGEERFAVAVAGSEQEYALSSYSLGNILKPLSDFEK